VLGDRRGNAVQPEEGEQLEEPFDVPVVGVQPELIEAVGAGALRIEPDVLALGLAELAAGGRREQGHHEAVHLPALPFADQVGARRDVAPLVAAAHLQLAAVGLEQVPEVVRLDQHVAELGVRNALLHPAGHRLLPQHQAEGEVLARVAEEVHQVQAAEPVGVVPEPRRVGALEGQEALQLLHERLRVPVDLLQRHDRPLGALAARIAHHARTAPHQGDRGMTQPLQPRHGHDRHQAADMQRVGRGIEADVGRDRPLAQPGRQPRGGVLHEAAGGQQLEKIGHRRVSYPLETCPATG
jgi:hypothetical protein